MKNKAAKITIPVSRRDQAVRALLCVFTPFGSIQGCDTLAGLMADWALRDEGERRDRLTQAIEARLRELDESNWSDFVPEGPFPGLRTPTSGTLIYLNWRGGGRGREGMPPHVLVDFGQSPSHFRMVEIVQALELAGLAYTVQGTAKTDQDEWEPATPIERKEVLSALRDYLEAHVRDIWNNEVPKGLHQEVASAAAARYQAQIAKIREELG